MKVAKLPLRHWLLIGSALLSTAAVYGIHRTYELREVGVHPRYPLEVTCVSKEVGGEAVRTQFVCTPSDSTHAVLFNPPASCHAQFRFHYMGKRGPTDWYRVSWTVLEKPGVTESRSEEFSYKSRRVILVDDPKVKIVAEPWQDMKMLAEPGPRVRDVGIH